LRANSTQPNGRTIAATVSQNLLLFQNSLSFSRAHAVFMAIV